MCRNCYPHFAMGDVFSPRLALVGLGYAINEKFGLDISVEVNSDILEEIMEREGLNDEGGESDG